MPRESSGTARKQLPLFVLSVGRDLFKSRLDRGCSVLTKPVNSWRSWYASKEYYVGYRFVIWSISANLIDLSHFFWLQQLLKISVLKLKQ